MFKSIALASLDEALLPDQTGDTTRKLEEPEKRSSVDGPNPAGEVPQAADINLQEVDVVLEELGAEMEECQKYEASVQAAPLEEMSPLMVNSLDNALEAQRHRLKMADAQKPITSKVKRGLPNRGILKARSMEAIAENMAGINTRTNQMLAVRHKLLKGKK